MSPSILDSVLAKLPEQSDPKVLIGFDSADDAGVYLVAPDLALVQTVDFFTPIVDDPYTFGEIAAANSLSDIYAMGAQPVSALSIVGFPNTGRDLDILEKIVLGGHSKMQEAGCAVIGGHSIGDEEIKFGYAVTGTANPNRIWANRGARPGDRLVLTKPLGTGIISTALKQERASNAAVMASIDSMRTLNRAASELARDFEIHAATDVTGFGLLGHAREVAIASGVSLVIDSDSIESLPEAVAYAREGLVPGGLKRNAEFLAGCVEFAGRVPEEVRYLLLDPQTSGGLLFALSEPDSAQLVEMLRGRDIPARQVGTVIEKIQPLIMVE